MRCGNSKPNSDSKESGFPSTAPTPTGARVSLCALDSCALHLRLHQHQHLHLHPHHTHTNAFVHLPCLEPCWQPLIGLPKTQLADWQIQSALCLYQRPQSSSISRPTSLIPSYHPCRLECHERSLVAGFGSQQSFVFTRPAVGVLASGRLCKINCPVWHCSPPSLPFTTTPTNPIVP